MIPEQTRHHPRSSAIRRMPQGRTFRGAPELSAISVSVVTYETSVDELRTLLGSLAKSRRRVDVVVVDNSPTEALRPIVEDAGVRYLPAGQNLGFGGGHNLAMRQMLESSTYHLVCNPDIHCGPEVLGALEAFMDASPEVGLVMPRIVYPDGQEQRLCKRLPTPVDLLVRRFLGKLGEYFLRRSSDQYELKHLDFRVTREVPSLSGCFMFLRTSVLRQTGLFDPRFFMYMEDVDLCRRVGAVSSTVFYPAVSVTHNYAKGSYKNRKLLKYHVASAVRYFSKWGWFADPERRTLNSRTEVLRQQPSPRESAPVSAATYAGTR
jgi:GT2 family glycosyltransferase